MRKPNDFDNNEKPKKEIDVHVSEAEEFEQPVQITRTKIIDDKYVIDRRHRKLIIEYRIGNLDENGNLVDVEEETVIYRDEEYDTKIKELFNDDKLFFAKGRNEGKYKINEKMKKIKMRQNENK